MLGVGLGLTQPRGRAPGGVEATGGTVTEVGGYKIHTFTTSGDFVVSSGGTVVAEMAGGNEVTFSGVQDGSILPIRVTALGTATTATGIVGLV